MSDHFIWTGGPIIAELGPLTLRWYGLLFALGFIIGFYIVRNMFLREGKPEADLDRLLLHLMLGTIIGARLGHCLFYDPGYYLLNPIEMLKVWRGGLASHGGLIGILTALYLYSRKRPRQPYLWVMDRVAVPTALAGCFIRLGNFFNSEILGHVSDVPWAIVFANVDGVDGPARHPAMLYESFAYFCIFWVLLFTYRKYRENTPRGMLTGLFMLLIFGARFLLEPFKIAQADFAETWALSMGQLLSLPAIALGLYLIWRSQKVGANPDSEREPRHARRKKRS